METKIFLSRWQRGSKHSEYLVVKSIGHLFRYNMSLFRVCSWWSAQCPDTLQSYHAQNITVCRFGLQENEKDYIVVTSTLGYLSIFYPAKSTTGGRTSSDLVLELKLSSPILGVAAGNFGR